MLSTATPIDTNLKMLSSTRPISSSTRTTKVIKELQDSLEVFQKELENTKLQLEKAQENKEQSETDNEAYIESNKKLRIDIEEIMQHLESKQQLLDNTKKASEETEAKVKQLKDGAMSARKELEDLKRRENTIEKECDAIKAQNQKHAQTGTKLEKKVTETKAKFDAELKALQTELESVQQKIEGIESADVTKVIQQTTVIQARERLDTIKHFEEIQKEIQKSNQLFIEQIQQELIDLIQQNQKEKENEELETRFTNCKEEVESLVARIKSNAQ